MNKIFVLTRKFSISTSQNAIKTVTVIGGGLMGSGIAQVSDVDFLKLIWSISGLNFL